MFRLMFSTHPRASLKSKHFADKTGKKENCSVRGRRIENLNSQMIVRRYTVDQGGVFFAR
ncbi:MAG: hypothetical protein M1503_02780 [Thaumarchaeota archaeon]|nr:hypothetical protein [Nitrososphaerota archaeon]MCL5317176.1 hypothetical protein [Nitrososphaerota archaeon]